MQSFTFWLIIALAGHTVAQDNCIALASSVLACATGCISSAASVIGCANGDYACQCTPASAASIQNLALGCAVTSCGALQALSASKSAKAVCSCISSVLTVTTSLPVTTTPASTPSSTSSSSPLETTSSSSPSLVSSPASGSETTSSTTGPITSPPVSSTTAGSSCSAGNPCQASADAIPDCGKGCLLSAGSANGCASADFKCQCDSSAVIQASAQNCVITSCVAKAIDVLNSANALCACVTASPLSTTSCPSSTSTVTPTITTTISVSETTPSSSSSASSSSPSPTSTACVEGTAPDCSSKAAAIPSCALSCFATSIGKIGCALNDYACQCTVENVNKITVDVAPCVAQNCLPSELALVQSAALDVCTCANSGSVGGTCTSSTGSISGTGTGSGGTKTTATGTTSEGGSGSTSTCVPSAGTKPDCAAKAAAIPSCATQCFATSIAKIGCAIDDYACQCTAANVAALTTDVTPCVAGICPATEWTNVQNAALDVCTCANTPATGGTTCSGDSGSGSGTTGGSGGSGTSTIAGSGGKGGNGGASVGSGSSTTCITIPASTPDCSAKAALIPSCALSCFSTAIANIGCSLTDYACQCTASNVASLTTAVTPCVAKSCTVISDLLAVQGAANDVCSCANSGSTPASTSCYAVGSSPTGGSGGGSGSGGSGSGSGSGSSAGLSSELGTKATAGAGTGTTCTTLPASTQTPDCSSKAALIPTCALSCLSTAISGIGCSVTDFACQCKADNKAKLTTAVTPCVVKACLNPSELAGVQSATDAVCACANSAGTVTGGGVSCFEVGSGTSALGSGKGGSVSTVTSSTKAVSTHVVGSSTGSAVLGQVTGSASRFSVGAVVAGAAVVVAAVL